MGSSRRSVGKRECGTAEERSARRAFLSAALDANREVLGMQVIAIMVQRYGVLPKELWDLNSISDMGAGRGLNDDEIRIPVDLFKKIVENTRYTIINLKIVKGVNVLKLLPNNLRRLKMFWRGYSFPVHFPDSLEELDISSEIVITQPLVLPRTLQKLRLDGLFRHSVTLPVSLLSLYVGRYYQNPILIPAGLKELRFDPYSGFNQPITFPTESSLNAVVFNNWYNQPTILPPSVKEVTFPPSFNQPVNFSSSSSLKTAIFLGELPYTHLISFPKGVEELVWSRHYVGRTLVLPEGLRKLTWGARPGADAVDFPFDLKELILTSAADISLPEGLVRFSFSLDGNTQVDLPESIEHVTWFAGVDNTFTHPSILPHLTVSGSWHADLRKFKIRKVTVEVRGSNIDIDSLYLPQTLEVLEITGAGGPERIFHTTRRMPRNCKVIGGTVIKTV